MNKLFICCIDGLDVSGKETLSKYLYNELKRYNLNVILKSFPDYESRSGKKILNLLHKGKLDKIDELFSLNRVEYFKKLKIEQDTILILDRYTYSTLFYNSDKGIELFKKEMNYSLIPDLTIIINATQKIAKKLHYQLINSKPNKDKNETIEKQIEVSEMITDRISYVYDYSKKTIVLEVGDSFHKKTKRRLLNLILKESSNKWER